MKGLQHSVIEIKDTDNGNIEKILVFLRPGQHKIDVNATRKEAQEILRKVKIRDRAPKIRIKPHVVAVWVSIIFSLVTLLVVIL